MTQEELSQRIGTITQLSKIIFQISVCVGVLVTIIYCGTIDYYPSGLTIGDAFFFVAASLSFSFTYTLVVLTLLCAGITFSPVLKLVQRIILAIPILRRRITNDNGDVFRLTIPNLGLDLFPIYIIGLFVFALTAAQFFGSIEKAWGLILAIFSMSFLYGAWHTKSLNVSPQKTEKQVRAGLAFLIFLTPLIVTRSQGNYLEQAMRLLGVRIENTTVLLSEKPAYFLSQNNINPKAENEKQGTTYEDVTILFRGIGESTVIEVSNMRLIVNNKDIMIGKSIKKE